MEENKKTRKKSDDSEKKSGFARSLESLEHDFEVTNPEEVEARLRNMFYGRPVN